jgi:hypothetical protein
VLEENSGKTIAAGLGINWEEKNTSAEHGTHFLQERMESDVRANAYTGKELIFLERSTTRKCHTCERIY